MKKTVWIGLAITFNLFLPGTMSLAVEKAFAPTPPGEIEIKELPPGVLLESSSGQSYFESDNQLFRPLFRYIRERDIAMTTPVEARIHPGRMYFWVAEGEVAKVDGDTDSVRVVHLPERKVASAGFVLSLLAPPERLSI